MKSGIYQIINTVNNKRYIGSSKDISHRLMRHRNGLRTGRHKNNHLLNAFKKYGIDSFIFEPIESCVLEILEEREQFWINQYDFKTLYNQRPLAFSNQGRKMSVEERLKRSGRICSEETRKKLGGKIPHNKTEHIRIECKQCAKEFFVEPNQADTKFCSRICFSNSRIGIAPVGVYKNRKQDGVHLQKSFQFVSPDLILYEGMGVLPFAKRMNLSSQHLGSVKTGNRKAHKGWRLPQPTDQYKEIVLFN